MASSNSQAFRLTLDTLGSQGISMRFFGLSAAMMGIGLGIKALTSLTFDARQRAYLPFIPNPPDTTYFTPPPPQPFTFALDVVSWILIATSTLLLALTILARLKVLIRPQTKPKTD